MLRVTMRGVRGHLLRFLLTACAVMLGVSFVTGTYVLTDSIDATLKGLFKQSLAGVDVSVAGAPLPDNGQGAAGQVFIGDTDLSRLGEKALTLLRRDRVGFVFQAFNLVPTLTAIENITLPMDLAGRKPDQAWLDRIVSTVGLADRLNHRPSQLSGGQQQRVAVARALAARPSVVFADEPTGNLDSRSGAEILGLMRRAVDELGQTIVMVTHDPSAAAHADRVVFLADGLVVDTMDEPTADRVLERMKAFGD